MSQAKIKVSRKLTDVSNKVYAATAVQLVASAAIAVISDGWGAPSTATAITAIFSFAFGYFTKDAVIPLSTTVVNDEVNPEDVQYD